MRVIVPFLLALLAACAPAAQAPVKPASADVRLVLNVDRGPVNHQSVLRIASQQFQEIGYTVLSTDDSFRDYGQTYNETLKANVDDAMRLASSARANYVIFIASLPTTKDPPPFSGLARYAEIRATASIVRSDGTLVRRLEVVSAGGSSNPKESHSEVVLAALPSAMKALAIRVNSVINP